MWHLGQVWSTVLAMLEAMIILRRPMAHAENVSQWLCRHTNHHKCVDTGWQC